MAFDVQSLRDAVARHGRVARIVLVEVKGSSPREVGAAMLVWADGQSGTIGGGALEYELAHTSRNLTKDALTRHALGPDMGQCCGGAVRVLTEFYNTARVEALDTTSDASIDALLGKLKSEGMTLDVLINNAGISSRKHPVDPILEADEEDVLNVFSTNGASLCC